MWRPAGLVLLLAVGSLADCPTGSVYDQNFNKCYKYVTTPTAFYLAEQECLSSGMQLASVVNGFENALISEESKQVFGAAKQFWIGGNLLLSTNWSWIDGSPFNYTNWANVTLSGQCASSSPALGTWIANDCSTAYPFVCSGMSVTTTKAPLVTCPPPPAIPSHCPSGWTWFSDTDFCYKVGHNKNWQDAESECVNDGAHLASMHSQSESEFINFLSEAAQGEKNAVDQVWFGLHKVNNQWIYTDGSKFDFINWQPKQPDNAKGKESCVQTFADYNSGKDGEANYHKWNDLDCSDSIRAYVCKKAALH